MSVQRAIEEWHAMQAGWRRTTTAVEMRLDWDAFLPNTDVSDEPVTIAGIPARWVGAGDRTLLYLHGGAYRIGSSQSHKGLAARIAAAAKCSVLLPDYRLAPEHRYPAAIDDAVTVYRWLLDEGRSNIAIAGDSAGGGLSVATMLGLRGSLPLPSAAVLLSPWTDFTVSGASYRTHQDQDPINRRVAVVALAADYLGDADARAASPLFAGARIPLLRRDRGVVRAHLRRDGVPRDDIPRRCRDQRGRRDRVEDGLQPPRRREGARRSAAPRHR